MKRSILLEEARTEEGKRLCLYERDGQYSIRVDGVELMSTRQHASEERLAELASEHLVRLRGARLLIGGLGLGYTLRAALRILPADARVVVAELSSAIVRWNRNPAYPLAADVLSDPRVVVREEDVAYVMEGARAGFDSILLDIDNGPSALTARSNARLYGRGGLGLARAALRPGGSLAVWSAAPDPDFTQRMKQAGFAVEEHRCRAHATSGGWHTLFVAHVDRS
jgi:spermidine synthase